MLAISVEEREGNKGSVKQHTQHSIDEREGMVGLCVNLKVVRV